MLATHIPRKQLILDIVSLRDSLGALLAQDDEDGNKHTLLIEPSFKPI